MPRKTCENVMREQQHRGTAQRGIFHVLHQNRKPGPHHQNGRHAGAGDVRRGRHHAVADARAENRLREQRDGRESQRAMCQVRRQPGRGSNRQVDTRSDHGEKELRQARVRDRRPGRSHEPDHHAAERRLRQHHDTAPGDRSTPARCGSPCESRANVRQDCRPAGRPRGARIHSEFRLPAAAPVCPTRRANRAQTGPHRCWSPAHRRSPARRYNTPTTTA